MGGTYGGKGYLSDGELMEDEEDLGDKAVLFMGTDGVFDCYDTEDLAKIVLESDPSTLLTQFRAKGDELFGEADDITYVVKKLK